MADLETYLSTLSHSELVTMLASRMRTDTRADTEAKRHDLGNGISLYKQNHSNKWYVRIHTPEDCIKDYRQSTKTTKLEDAKAIAYQIAAGLRLKLSEGIPLKKQVIFATAAQEIIKFYSTRNKSNDRYYISIIHNYLLPAFGNMEVIKVNDRSIRLFWNDYVEKHGTTPSKSFKNTVNIVLKRILIEAKEQGLITVLPELSSKVETRIGKTGEHWERDEISFIFNKLDDWCNNETRVIFKSYCKFLLETGCRTGREALGITWRDIERQQNIVNGWDYYCTIRKGKLEDTHKAGRQILIARGGEVSIIISEILSFIAKHQGFKGVVDAMQNGKDRNIFEVKSQDYLWNKFARNYGINGTLYWFRHTHITNRILKGEMLTNIATECGTSVKMIEQHYGHATAKRFRQAELLSKGK
ncbi:site-specific integrase [Aeromonas bestiarum]|nr:site-specific integrase [Aeromonas bestiarum]